MSVRKAASIEALSDAGTYDTRDGTITLIGSKIHQPPGIVGVVVGIGVGVVPRLLAGAASGMCQDFDGFVAHFDEVLAWVDAEIAKNAAYPSYYRFVELFIAGWSTSRGQPETYHLIRHDKGDPELAEAFRTLTTTSPFFGRGPIEPLGVALSQRDPEGIELATDGLAVMEAMRATKTPYSVGSHVGYGVGGFAELATITSAAVERRIVRRWPDEVGRAIRPESD